MTHTKYNNHTIHKLNIPKASVKYKHTQYSITNHIQYDMSNTLVIHHTMKMNDLNISHLTMNDTLKCSQMSSGKCKHLYTKMKINNQQHNPNICFFPV